MSAAVAEVAAADGRLSWGSAFRLARVGVGADRLRWVAFGGALCLLSVVVNAGQMVALLPWLSRPEGPVGEVFALDFLRWPGNLPGVFMALVCACIPLLMVARQASHSGLPVRRRRMAAMRSCGATSSDLRRIAGAEAFLISAVAGALGWLFFAGLWWMASHRWRAPIGEEYGAHGIGETVPMLPAGSLQWWMLPLGLLISVLIGLGLGASIPLDDEDRPPGERARWATGLVLLGVSLVALYATFALPTVMRESSAANPAALAAALVALAGWVVGWLALSPAITAAIGGQLRARASSPVALLAGASMVAHPRLGTRSSAILQLVAVCAAADLVLRPVLRLPWGRRRTGVSSGRAT